MKRSNFVKLLTTILSVCLLLTLFSACDLGLGKIDLSLRVKFVVDGEIYQQVTSEKGATVALPEDPEKSGYIFDGWYLDDGTFEKPFDGKVSGSGMISFMVYGKWRVCTHDITSVSAKSATCTEVGWYAYEYCSLCPYTTYVEIPALGHIIKVGDAKTPTESDQIGWDEYEYCDREGCDYTTKQEYPWHEHKDELTLISAQAPTCEDYGWTEYYSCSHEGCNFSEEQLEAHKIPAIGHDPDTAWTKGETTHYHVCRNEGCTEKLDEATHADANKDHACDVCGKVISTCVDEDKDHACDICGKVLSAHDYTIAYSWNNDHSACQAVKTCKYNNAHKISEDATVATVTKEATCAAKGSVTYTATFTTANGFETQIYVQELAIDASNHAYGDLVAQVSSTCTSEGTKAHYHCACGKYFDESKNEVEESALVIPAHTYENHFCKDCGAPEAGRYYYSLVQQNLNSVRYYALAKMSGYYLGTTTDVTQAAIVTVAIVDGGYTLKIGDNKYLNAVQSGTYYNVELSDTAITWAWNADYGFMTISFEGGTSCALGAFGTKTTIGGVANSYFGKSGEYFCEFTPVCTGANHNFDAGVETKEPTCMVKGIKTYTCALCNGTKVEDIALVDHTLGDWIESTATCTVAGEKAHYHCSVCEQNFDINQNVISDLAQPALGHKDDNGDGKCDVCDENMGGTTTPQVEIPVAVFTFGVNGAKGHVDGDSIDTGKTYTNGAYSLALTDCEKVYDGAYDLMGNSCLKLGTGSNVGSFKFVVPDAITKVTIYVAKYKAIETKVTINGTSHTIKTSSNDGKYTEIVIDTTSNKTITLSVDTKRCMIDEIVYYTMADQDTLSTYTVTAQAENATVKFLDTETGEYSLTALDMFAGSFKFKVTATDGYKLDSVKIGNNALSADENGVYTSWAVDGNVTIAVTVLKTYTVTAQAENATVKFYNEATEKYDLDSLTTAGEFKFKVTAVDGYKIDSVKIGDKALTAGTDGVYTSTITNSNLTVVVATSEESTGGETGGSETPQLVATFDFGANGTAEHNDGDTISNSKEYTNGDYKVSLANCANVYDTAYDAKGNSCLKLGTSKKAGSFEFTVADNVTQVVIYVAKYKANSGKVKINGKEYTLESASNDGKYDKIIIDTSVNKTVKFEVSSGKRCMINTIEYYAQSSV